MFVCLCPSLSLSFSLSLSYSAYVRVRVRVRACVCVRARTRTCVRNCVQGSEKVRKHHVERRSARQRHRQLGHCLHGGAELSECPRSAKLGLATCCLPPISRPL